MIIPPSVPMLMYAVATSGASVGKLFLQARDWYPVSRSGQPNWC
ncbi:MAG: hypothetical protein M0C28_41440 [Candidatus Moduliflexus flocculans]|nr:hypothetical protein [Candidatus Moduliflexus flocculans]